MLRNFLGSISKKIPNNIKISIDDKQWTYFTDQPYCFLIASFGNCVFNCSAEDVDSLSNAFLFDYADLYHNIGFCMSVEDNFIKFIQNGEDCWKIERDNKM